MDREDQTEKGPKQGTNRQEELSGADGPADQGTRRQGRGQETIRPGDQEDHGTSKP